MFSKRSSLRQPTSLRSQHSTTSTPSAFSRRIPVSVRPPRHSKVWIRCMTSPLALPPPSPPLIEVRLLNRSTKQRHPVAYHGSLTDGPGGGGALFCGDLEELRGQAYRHLLFHQRLPSRWWHEQPKCVRGEDATVVKGLTKLIIKKWCLLLEQNHGVL